ncbi:MAG: electron transport complex subunit RsxC [Chitinivibrionia bacterium]|nr:electron transport complex subunit RsxC [Chitinivibrionia bacterium]
MFRKYTFPGGIHPPYNKEATKDLPVVKYPLPKKVVVPTLMHIGHAAKVIVKNGDRVSKGQCVAEANGFVSSPAFSPVSGVVSAVGIFAHASGKSVTGVEITSNNLNEEFRFDPMKNWKEQAAAVLVKRISDCGIVGMGGAGFPSHVKLSPPADKAIDSLIINAVECEPYLTTDHRLMLERPESILWGTKIFQRILDVKDVYVAIEKNKPDAIENMKKYIDQNKEFSKIKVVTPETKYPQGGEKQLVFTVLGREIPSGKLTMDAGCVVQNTASAIAAYNAVIKGIPLTQRVITVTGEAVKNPGNYSVPIGTSVREILEHCQTDFSKVKKVIMGGPMMGISLASIDVPVMKQTSGLLVLSNSTPAVSENNCISCGFCVRKCPVRLVPSILSKYAEKKMFDEARERNVMDCMECGCCSYVCPAKINILHRIRFAKNYIVCKEREKQLTERKK